MLEDNFNKNINALIRQNYPLAQKLLKIETNKEFEVFQGKDPIDINMYDYENKVSIYKYPIKETEEMIFKFSVELVKFPVLYFYGIGNGIFFKVILQSNKHLKRVILVEPKLELLYIALHINDFSKYIINDRFIINISEDMNFTSVLELVSIHKYKAYFKLYKLHTVTDYYINTHSKDIIDVNLIFTKAMAHSITSHGNSTIDNLQGLEHHIENIPNMVNSLTMFDVYEQKNSDLAVVVSLGPSLTKQLKLLRENQDYITVIAPEASLQVCYENGIKPDVVVSLERTDSVAKLMKKVSYEAMKDTNFLVASLMHRDSIKEFKKGNLAIVQRPLLYCTMFEELKDWGYIGIGMSVSNMAADLAYILKYKHIVLIGQDLAYGKDGESHAKGNVFGARQLKPTDTDTEVLAYGGEGMVKTSFSWNLFREYFEKFAKEAKEHSGLELINATEGGARIEGSIEMPFAEVIEKYADKSKTKIPMDFKKFKKRDDKLKLKILKQSQRRLNHMEKYGKIVQKMYEKVFIDVSDLSDEMIKLNKKNRVDKLDVDRLKKVSDDIDKVKSLFDKKLFQILFFETMQSDLMAEELEIAKIVVKVPKNEDEKNAIMIDWVMKHRYLLFVVAGNINAQLEIVRRSRVNLDNEIEKLSKKLN